ncbi:bifunctional hydroxymethylpyrimidine kinase/phosphomethylpyrimidine kinase [Glutamicibacter endophyticus]
MSLNILSIAGSDPSGGAGIQADLKTIAACGGYGMSAITALTAQNTQGVRAVHAIEPEFVGEQLRAVSEDVRIDAVKIGMLSNAAVIAQVADWLAHIEAPVVLDPVMIATSGDSLLDADATAALQQLLPRATVLTPNIDELAALSGQPVPERWEEVIELARQLADRHDVLVVAKGGHLNSSSCPDALVGAYGVLAEYSSPRIDTTHTHGTGCTLSSALATYYAATSDWSQALEMAKSYLSEAISGAASLQVGSGHGPVDHLGALHRAADSQSGDPMLEWWDRIADIRAQIDDLEFIRQLANGTLPRADFDYYINQDALYLRTYAKVLARASEISSDIEAQRFWAIGCTGILDGEMELHRGFLPHFSDTPSETTLNYVNHLSSCTANYSELIAAILPCYWIYQDVGQRLAAASHPEHPYAAWLAEYSSPEFDAATTKAIDLVRAAWRRADAATRQRMWLAFERSSRHELYFFAQAAARVE